ncbi:MAG: hypothetical protein M3680_25570, partial [Myxococcota bacterium]|nr:hypothetical protein [Myxococcota bacterium]
CEQQARAAEPLAEVGLRGLSTFGADLVLAAERAGGPVVFAALEKYSGGHARPRQLGARRLALRD